MSLDLFRFLVSLETTLQSRERFPESGTLLALNSESHGSNAMPSSDGWVHDFCVFKPPGQQAYIPTRVLLSLSALLRLNWEWIYDVGV